MTKEELIKKLEKQYKVIRINALKYDKQIINLEPRSRDRLIAMRNSAVAHSRAKLISTILKDVGQLESSKVQHELF